jgi:AcrR family transcriptional regulator
MPVPTRVRTIIDTARRRPRQERSRATVDAIVEAAAQVFEREGLAATTNRIAERAGVSIGTLYQYFPNKHALLAELADRHIAASRARLDVEFDRIHHRRQSWEDAVAALVTALVEAHGDRPRLHALMHQHAPRVPAGVAALHALQDRVVEQVAALLRERGRGGPDPARTAALLVHAVDAQLHRVLLTGEADVDDLIRMVLAMTG